jgi:hypothetical protein
MTTESKPVIDVRIITSSRMPVCRECWDRDAPQTLDNVTYAPVKSQRGMRSIFDDRKNPGTCYMLSTAEQAQMWRDEHPTAPAAADRNRCVCCGRKE